METVNLKDLKPGSYVSINREITTKEEQSSSLRLDTDYHRSSLCLKHTYKMPWMRFAVIG